MPLGVSGRRRLKVVADRSPLITESFRALMYSIVLHVYVLYGATKSLEPRTSAGIASRAAEAGRSHGRA